MTNPLGARKDGNFMAIASAPSFNYTPVGDKIVVIPYITVADLSNCIGTADNVRFNGKPAVVLDQTIQPTCIGDAAGSLGGIRSGTVGGPVTPIEGSRTVRINGKSVVREGDHCFMNGGNNLGTYVVVPPVNGSIKDGNPTVDTNPPIVAETPEEAAWLAEFASEWEKDNATANVEFSVGAVKGAGNSVVGVAELLMKGGLSYSAGRIHRSLVIGQMFNKNPDSAEDIATIVQPMYDQADTFKLSKFEMSNEMQKKGAFAFDVASLFAGGIGLVKSGITKLLVRFGKGTKTAQGTGDVTKAAEEAAKRFREAEATKLAQGKRGDGVRIVAESKVVMRSPSDSMGVEPASSELLAAIGNKRTLTIATPGSDELRMLNYFGAEASVGGVNNSSILLRQNPSKAAALEEFLHGTQSRLGIVDRLGTSGLGSAETHVKDFMIRHQKMLGLGAEDVRILQILRDKGL